MISPSETWNFFSMQFQVAKISTTAKSIPLIVAEHEFLSPDQSFSRSGTDFIGVLILPATEILAQ